MTAKDNTQYTIYGSDGDRPPLRRMPPDGVEVLLEHSGLRGDVPCLVLTEAMLLLADGTAQPLPVGLWTRLPVDVAEQALQVPLPEGLQWRRR